MDLGRMLLSLLLVTSCTQMIDGNGLQTQLLFCNEKSIFILDTQTGNTTTVASGLSNAFNIDYHFEKNMIFWSDYGTMTISRIVYPSVQESSPEVIIKGTNPYGIAVDPINDLLVWSDYGTNKLYKSQLDGSNSTVILDSGFRPYNLELDYTNGWIYLTDTSQIYRCRLDGTDLETIKTGSGSVHSMFLEMQEGRIYWTDHERTVLQSAFFNGTDVKIEFDFSPYGNNIFGITLDKNYIYFSEWIQGNLYQVSRHNNPPDLKLIYRSSNNDELLDIEVYKLSDGICFNYSTISDEERRSAHYQIQSSDQLIYSDHELERNWYRITSQNGEKIPNYPPGELHCGTQYPIWINGTLTSDSNENMTLQACMQTSIDVCEETFDIDVMNCGSYFLYYLVNTRESSAYCFGDGPVRCPSGQSSQTGFYPNCSSSFPNNTVTPEVRAVLALGPGNVYFPSSLIPVFQCEFDKESISSFVFDVYWYINGDEIVVYTNVQSSNTSFTDLRGSQWIDTHHMNMEVWCALRIRYSVDSIPSPFYRSSTFKAGLFPEKGEYFVVEGDHINITLTTTVPVGCLTSDINFRETICGRTVYSFVPTQVRSVDGCSRNVDKRDILFRSFTSQSCGTVLDTTNGTQVKTLQVFGFIDGKYNYKDRSTYIRLSTRLSADSNDIDIWKNLTVLDIKVNVIDKDTTLSGRMCQCYNDPHFRTFDGRIFHYMEVGEFVLYRNDRGPYWVHALFSNCGFGWTGSSCNCGVAVRSRNSLFVIRTCKTVSRTDTVFLTNPHIERKSCDESDFTVDLRGNHYTIILPIGTEIRFSVSSSRFIPSISIKPAIYDIAVARGLCGVPSVNKDTSDDFLHKYTDSVVDEKSFADSWRISPNDVPNEQLFVTEPSFLVNTPDSGNNEGSNNNGDSVTIARYCVCESEARQGDKFDNFFSFHCNLTEPSETCLAQSQGSGTSNDQTTIDALPTTCSVTDSRRKRSVPSHHQVYKRSLDDSDDVIEPEEVEFDENVESNNTRNETLDFKDGWTEDTARETCEKKLNNTVPTDIYEDDNGINDSNYIESCILDIKMTSSTIFVEDTVSAMQTYTLMEVLRNETLENATTDDGSQTILDYITSQLCPGNCNNNGNCTLGSCYCFDGYYGEDCSGTTLTPPRNYSLPSAGLCGTRSRACKRTNIYGNFPSDKVWCKKRHFQIAGNVTSYAENHTIEQAVYRNQFMVSVDISPPSVSRKKRSTREDSMAQGYEIGLSNDGTTFGESVNVIIYDEKCSDCNPGLMSCVSLSTCPEYDTSTPTENTTTLETSTRQMTSTQHNTATDMFTTEPSTEHTTEETTQINVQQTTTEKTTHETTLSSSESTTHETTHSSSEAKAHDTTLPPSEATTHETTLPSSEATADKSTLPSSEVTSHETTLPSSDATTQYKSSTLLKSSPKVTSTTGPGITTTSLRDEDTSTVGKTHLSTGRRVDTTTSSSWDIPTLLLTTSKTENEENVPGEQVDLIVPIVGATCLVLVLVVMVILVALIFRRRLTEKRKRAHQIFQSESDHIQHDSWNMSGGKPREARSADFYGHGFVQPCRFNSTSWRSGSKKKDEWQKRSTFFDEYIQG